MIETGLDRLLADPARLRGRSYGLLAHGAAVAHGSVDPRSGSDALGALVAPGCIPAHLALARGGLAPARLFGPEHGYYGVEQDMVAAADARDPWTGVPIVSLYGAGEPTLRPRAEAFSGLDLLVIDLQDVGARYYTYAATAVWAAEAALAAGCEVWLLDRPNPLGGLAIEGNWPEQGSESFVGAFRLPVRHGLTLGELLRLEARRRGLPPGIEVWAMSGWRRDMLWPDTGLPWIAPSPNMPAFATALIYPGGCLIEATRLSEGRGTTRPFQLVGAPGIDPPALADALTGRRLPGVAFLPTFFRPQFQKHAGEVCGGVELVVTDAASFRPYRAGVEVLAALACLAPLSWRAAPYEFVADRPAIDLLTGGARCRLALERGAGAGAALEEWVASWAADEESFRRERAGVLLYPEES
jgi:uncharacterized protein YbbC (DUF1343 family)